MQLGGKPRLFHIKALSKIRLGSQSLQTLNWAPNNQNCFSILLTLLCFSDSFSRMEHLSPINSSKCSPSFIPQFLYLSLSQVWLSQYWICQSFHLKSLLESNLNASLLVHLPRLEIQSALHDYLKLPFTITHGRGHISKCWFPDVPNKPQQFPKCVSQIGNQGRERAKKTS